MSLREEISNFCNRPGFVPDEVTMGVDGAVLVQDNLTDVGHSEVQHFTVFQRTLAGIVQYVGVVWGEPINGFDWDDMRVPQVFPVKVAHETEIRFERV